MKADFSYSTKNLLKKPIRFLNGIVGAYIAYPLAEHLEKRIIRPKIAELREHYALPFDDRRKIALDRLSAILEFSGENVPYYRDLFGKLGFNASKVRKDFRYLLDLPYLTKDIIRAEGPRMFSRPLESGPHHARKTGGSTGLSCMFYYDQEGLDYTSAVLRYTRNMGGKPYHKSELHFACRFPDAVREKGPTREDFKCFSMNRSNIFFSRIDDVGLEEIWQTLRDRRPFLIHSHPSTIYALACYVERQYGSGTIFKIFESSGELLQPYQREKISKVFQCDVVDRYGLAELGVMAYELEGPGKGLKVLDSEGWPESRPQDDAEGTDQELVFTGFRNRLMPLIRYRTGDMATVEDREQGFYLTHVVGRIHDTVQIRGISYPTHHIMDILDHRVGGVQEFQIDLRTSPPTLKIVPEPSASEEEIRIKIERVWPDGFDIRFVGHDDFVRVGRLSKFRHVVNS